MENNNPQDAAPEVSEADIDAVLKYKQAVADALSEEAIEKVAHLDMAEYTKTSFTVLKDASVPGFVQRSCRRPKIEEVPEVVVYDWDVITNDLKHRQAVANAAYLAMDYQALVDANNAVNQYAEIVTDEIPAVYQELNLELARDFGRFAITAKQCIDVNEARIAILNPAEQVSEAARKVYQTVENDALAAATAFLKL